MNCRDFREIADSYLSDELAVETNHEIFQHLESCAICRQELAARREIREKLRLSLQRSDEFKLNPTFAEKLKTTLQEEAFHRHSWFNWKILTPAVAGLLIVAGLTFGLLYRSNQPNLLADLSKKAISRHEDCGLKNIKQWEKFNGKAPVEKISFVKSLENSETRILSAHDCEFEGKSFTHYILMYHGKLISVLKIPSENIASTNPTAEAPIICNKEHGLQMASFKVKEDFVFVISDMTETENLSLARTLSDNLLQAV